MTPMVLHRMGEEEHQRETHPIPLLLLIVSCYLIPAGSRAMVVMEIDQERFVYILRGFQILCVVLYLLLLLLLLSTCYNIERLKARTGS